MPMNRVHFQPGLSMPEVWTLYGTEELCEGVLIARRGPAGFVCARLGGPRGPNRLRAAGAAALAVRRLPAPVQRHQRHDLRGQPAAVDELVPRDAPADIV